jgi:transposase-like protein
MHHSPEGRFYQRGGSYRPKCRNHPIPRFRCRVCREGFSYQSFRADFGDHRPHDNGRLFDLLVSGVGFRQAGRVLRMDVRAVQQKFRKQSRHLRRLTRNFTKSLPPDRTFVFDEMETFEHRSICPLTVPIVVERDSKFVVAATAGSIRRRARRGSRRERWLARHERLHGRRKDRSRRTVKWLLRRLRRLLGSARAVLLCDEKSSYRTLCGQVFGDRVQLRTSSSRLRRDTHNPLFAINLTDAMLRDNCGRLRRHTWLVSKLARWLRRQLDLFAAYRNWHRPRTNRDPEHYSPGVALGLIDRSLAIAELHSWRQDWSDRSIHPASVDGASTVTQKVA